MNKFLELFLGILTAMGGFVEIGELTFAINTGSKFHYQLLWLVLVGTVGIIVYCEMAGRIAAVRQQPVFNLIRERTGFKAGLLTLVAANLVSLLTCAAEVGAIAMLWQLMSGWPYRALILIALAFFLLVVWFFKFSWIERVFGLMGLLMIVFIVTAIKLHPDWHQVAAGLVPAVPRLDPGQNYALYGYYAVAMFSSILLPYETYFYASGAMEDKWKPSDIPLNRIIVILGFSLGALLSASLVVVGAAWFSPLQVEAALPGTSALAAAAVFGKAGLFLALAGMFFAFAGAAIENALTCAYNLAQFMGWPWGKFRTPREASRFTLSWIGVFVLAAAIVMTGVDPIAVVEYSIVFAVVILPLTYLPMLLIAQDRRVMRRHANGRFASVMGWSYFVLICVAAVAAIPLLVATHGGRG